MNARPPMLLAGIAAIALASAASAQPRGDFMDEPIRMAGTAWTTTVDTTRATAEPGEPSHGSWADKQVPAAHSLWFAWTAPVSGRVQFMARSLGDTEGTWFPGDSRLFLAAYTNDATRGLQRFLRSRVAYWTTAGISLPVTEGVPYRFAMDSHGLATGGFDVALAYTDNLPPPNDTPNQALDLTSAPGFAVFDLFGATRETGDPNHGSYGRLFFGNRFWEVEYRSRGGESIWYSWTAPRTGEFSVLVAMPGSFPQLAVYRDSDPVRPEPDLARCVLESHQTNGTVTVHRSYDPVFMEWTASESAFQGTHSLKSRFDAAKGERFLFHVDQMVSAEESDFRPGNYPSGLDPSENSVGLIRINVRMPNDELAAALPLTANAAEIAWGEASIEAGELGIAGGGTVGSWWWYWTPEQNETVAIRPANAQVFLGETLPDLLAIATGRPVAPSDHATFEASAGVRHLIRIKSSGLVPVEVEVRAGGHADRIEKAQELRPEHGRIEARIPLALMTLQDGEPGFGELGVHGVGWATWFAEKTGRYRFTSGSSPRVFRGTDLTSKAPVQAPWSDGQLMVEAVAGERFWFAFLTGPAGMDSTAVITLDPMPAHDSFEFPITAITGSLHQVRESIGSAEFDEPDHAGLPPVASLWYRWTCPGSGRYSLVIEGLGGPRVALYRGGLLATLNLVAELAAIPEGIRAAPFEAHAGDEFRIAVEPGRLTTPGIRWGVLDNGPEDRLSTAIPLDERRWDLVRGVPGREAVDDTIQTPVGYGSAWFRYTASPRAWPTMIRVRLDVPTRGRHDRPPMLRLFRQTPSGDLFPTGTSASPIDSDRTIALCPVIVGSTILVQAALPEDQPLLGRVSAEQISVPTSPPPTLLELLAVEDGLRLSGPPGTPVRLQRSLDLLRWGPAGDAECRSPFLDLRAATDSHAAVFYRVMSY